MIDLDGLKPVNDKYGHVFGDRLLRAAASEISRSLRTPDVAARYGGDEFAGILPQTQPEGAPRVCERIPGAGEQLAPNAGGAPGSPTAPPGVARRPPAGLHRAPGAIPAPARA